MLKDQVDKAAFLREALNWECIENSPITGKPRITLEANDVWQAIEQYGGIVKVCHDFEVNGLKVHGWIDDHWIPIDVAVVIAKKIGAKDVTDFLAPSTGYHDEATGEYWPMSWNPVLIR